MSKESKEKTEPNSAAAGPLGIGDPPSADDPKGRAEYFMGLLDALAQQGTADAKRVRSGLISAIQEFSEAAEEQKEEAQKILTAKLYGLEAGVAELMLRSTTRMRDEFAKQARSLGANTPAGKAVRTAADGLNLIVDATQKMLEAAMQKNDTLRDEATAMMNKARELMESLTPGATK